MASILGDCNTDGKTDILDFQLLSNSFGKAAGQTGYNPKCDFNSSNSVEVLDFQILSNNFGVTGTTNTPTVRPAATSTPYPTTSYSGRIYYVSKNGNNMGGTSWTNAWNELNQINWQVVQAGDVIEIDGGSSSMTYSSLLTVGNSGTVNSPILITKSQTHGRSGAPTITGGLTVSGNYVTIRGLTVKKTSGDAVLVRGGDYVTLDSLVVEHPGGRGIKADGYSNPVNYITIKNSHVDTTGNVKCTNPQQVDNLYLQYGTNPVIEDNTLINRGGCNISGGPHVDIVQMYYMDNITIRNNLLDFVAGTGNDQSQTSMITYFDGFVKIYNNVVFACPKGHGLYLGFEDGGSGSEIFLWNNTIKAQEPNGYALGMTNVNPGSIKAIKNNIFIAGPNGGYTIFTDNPISGSGVVDYNIHDNNNYALGVAYMGSKISWSSWQTSGHDTHGYNTDPDLNPNLEPDEGTDPSVNHGTSIPEFSSDKNSVHRPQGAAWDIGAYEYAF